MRSETTILKGKLSTSITATKFWMQRAISLEAEIEQLRAKLDQAKEKDNATG